jgi:hypothetical protein
MLSPQSPPTNLLAQRVECTFGCLAPTINSPSTSGQREPHTPSLVSGRPLFFESDHDGRGSATERRRAAERQRRAVAWTWRVEPWGSDPFPEFVSPPLRVEQGMGRLDAGDVPPFNVHQHKLLCDDDICCCLFAIFLSFVVCTPKV